MASDVSGPADGTSRAARTTVTRSDLVSRLKGWGVRVTAQRLAVAEVLANSTDHPTAQEVYERVASDFPHITLATVYNTMSILTEKGFVQPLLFPSGTRYDANPSPHANLICIQCGGIEDADMDEESVVFRLREGVTAARGFLVMGQRLDFYGVCSDCSREGEAL